MYYFYPFYPFDLSQPYVRISLGAERQSNYEPLREVSDFMRDFNLLYEILRLATDTNYARFRFSSALFTPTGRPLTQRDRLNVERISYGSPLDIAVVVAAVPAAVGAIWGIVQIFEKVYNFSLNRRKLEAEIKKLEHENPPLHEAQRNMYEDSHLKLPPPDFSSLEEVNTVLEKRGADRFVRRIERRLRYNSIQVTYIKIEVVNPDDKAE